MNHSIDYAHCTFSCTALANEALLVADWSGDEAVSRPYRFEVRLAVNNHQLDYESMLGSPACLSFVDQRNTPQRYHGVVTQVVLLERDELYTYYRVVLEPRLALLRQQRHSQTWLDKTLPELIREVLGELGEWLEGPAQCGEAAAPGYDFAIRLPAEDEPRSRRSFSLQFEENSLDFLSRKLEFFGVYYYFEQLADREAVVFCGAMRLQPNQPLAVYYRPHSTVDAPRTLAGLQSFQGHCAGTPKSVHLGDFSASKANLELAIEASVQDREAQGEGGRYQGFGEQRVYGEHYGSLDEGRWLASLRAQALACRRRQFSGAGRLFGLCAGYPIRLNDHFRPEFNSHYWVEEVQHQGSQPLPGQHDEALQGCRFSQRFRALPSDVQYRPACNTPRPRVVGLFSAIVEGDELDRPLLNEHGCYRLIFPFARERRGVGKGSAWVRPMCLSSGERHGMHFPLLKGSEVLVAFIGGDPDRPLITGTAANSEHPSPINDQNCTQRGFSSPGGHYLAMEDSAAGPLMRMASPVGNSRLTLGSGERPGVQLSTGEHLDISSATQRREVPGLYWEHIGLADSGALPADESGAAVEEEKKEEQKEQKEPQKPKPDDLTIKFKTAGWEGGESWRRAGVNSLVNLAPILMRGTLAAEQLGFNAGALKQDINLMAMVAELNLAGPKVEVQRSLYNKQFFEGKSTIFTSKKTTAMNNAEAVLTYEKEAQFATYKSKVYSLEAEESIVLRVGGSTLTFSERGILVSSPGGQITLEAKDLFLKGDVLISGQLEALGSLSLAGDADVFGNLRARTGEFSQGMKSPDLAVALAPTPPVPSTAKAKVSAAEAELEAALLAFNVDIEAAESFRLAANAAPKAGG